MTILPHSRIAYFTRRPRVRSLAAIAVEYGWIAAAILLARRFPHPLVYLASVVTIGSRQHALLVLLHEGVHRQLSSSKRVNDLVADVLLAWPFFLDLATYRRFHLGHHKHLNSEQDPESLLKSAHPREWKFPRSRSSLALLVIGDLVGLHAGSFIAHVRRMKHTSGVPHRLAYDLARGGALAATLLVLGFAGAWVGAILFWIVPASTTLVCSARLREICEHNGVAQAGELASARTTRVSALGRFLVAPRNVSYHIEHHLFPNVPWFRLRHLHRELAQYPEYRQNAHVTRGFVSALAEISS